MSVVNPLARELSAKIVFYGPGLSGKTSSLAAIHAVLQPSSRGELVSLETEGDRTLFFDFLPLRLPKIGGLNLRLQLYTVPGQVFYAATRQLVLEGADGVVFVADSQHAAHERNLESLDDLKVNLQRWGRSLQQTPHIFQYNKRDLPDILDVAQLSRELNEHDVPEFETCASTGQGLKEALKTMIRLVADSLAEKQASSRQRGPLNRQPMSTTSLEQEREDQDMASQVTEAIASLDSSLRAPAVPSFLGDFTSPVSFRDEAEETTKRDHELKTIQAPAHPAFSLASLWDTPKLIRSIEEDIRTGQFAEAVHRAASGVSEILDGLLGPHIEEGSAARALLLGLDGREYIELRRLASRPASAITQNEALFALYVLLSARIKEQRLVKY